MQDRKMVKIGPLPGRNYAEMVAEVLQKKGISVSISQDGVATAYGISGTNLAGNEAYLMVPPEFEEDARQLVEQLLDHI
ncbi:hypothetical protein B1H10_04925 [candidate division KSB1 bacterium 4484_188]|nr:MAG: hypothetical protein B1H10_04925 [candidate division KSB1 bacterium 4484_188]HFE65134.1 hypothetical protein [Caldithrix sp.]